MGITSKYNKDPYSTNQYFMEHHVRVLLNAAQLTSRLPAEGKGGPPTIVIDGVK